MQQSDATRAFLFDAVSVFSVFGYDNLVTRHRNGLRTGGKWEMRHDFEQ